MKLRWKIYIICISIYITALVFTSIIVTENTYESLLKKEVERVLQEEKNMHDSAVLFLLSSQKLQEERIDLEHYSSIITDIFSGKNSIIEIYNSSKGKISSNADIEWSFTREDLDKVLEDGKCYVIRKENKKKYIFVTDLIKLQQEELIISYIKDISEIDVQKNEQYMFFLRAAVLGLCVMAFIVVLVSRIIVRPIDKLLQAAEKIAKGNYEERVEIKGKDEISDLGSKFNAMAEEIEHKIQTLQIESERKQRFIDNLSHELRTPLTSIIGYSELLQKISYEESTFNKALSYIHSEGNRMLRLSNSLMDIILNRENPLDLKYIEALSLLNEVRDIIKPKLHEKELSIHIVGENKEILVDKEMIKGVLINLVDNAIKASNPKDEIILGTFNEGQSFIIFVEDKGRGIEESEIGKITEPFYRVDKARAKKDGGAGLGLAICSQIIEKHNAKLKIESKLGEGTKVSIIFNSFNWSVIKSE